MKSEAKYKQLSEKVNWWDNKPYNNISLKGRVLRCFSPSYFQQIWGLSGERYYGSLPTRERLTGQRILEEFVHHNEQKNNSVIPSLVNTMEVPADVLEKWSSISPLKYFESYKNRKELLDRYLSTFDAEKRNKIVQTMCSGESINYISFLETDPADMNEQQIKIYDDIITHYENYYINEMRKQNALTDQYLSNQKTLDNISTNNIYSESNSIERETPVSKLVQNNYHNEFMESISGKEIASDSNNLETSKSIDSKPLNFTDSIKTSRIVQPNIYVDKSLNKAQVYTPNENRQDIKVTDLKDYHSLPNLQLKNLFNIPQCYNIADLISARKQAEDTNRNIIHDIVADQIHTNTEVANLKNNPNTTIEEPVKVPVGRFAY